MKKCSRNASVAARTREKIVGLSKVFFLFCEKLWKNSISSRGRNLGAEGAENFYEFST